MADQLQWRKRAGLTQVEAAALLGVSQPYLSLLERGIRPLTPALRNRINASRRNSRGDDASEQFRAQLGRHGYPGFAHVKQSGRRMRADVLLAAVLAMCEADARVAEALPWLVKHREAELDFDWLVRQAKLGNFQNRLGFVIESAGVDRREGTAAVRELERARLLQEDTLCWDSMPAATRDWMRIHRSPLAARWNLLTMVGGEDGSRGA